MPSQVRLCAGRAIADGLANSTESACAVSPARFFNKLADRSPQLSPIVAFGVGHVFRALARRARPQGLASFRQ